MSSPAIEKTLSFVQYVFYTAPDPVLFAADVDRILAEVLGQEPTGEQGLDQHRRVTSPSYGGPQELTARLVDVAFAELVWFQRGDFHCVALLEECRDDPTRWSAWLDDHAARARRAVQAAEGFELAAFVDLSPWPEHADELLRKIVDDALFLQCDLAASTTHTSIRVARAPDRWWFVAAPADDVGSRVAARYLLQLNEGTLPLALLSRTALRHEVTRIAQDVVQLRATISPTAAWLDGAATKALALGERFHDTTHHAAVARALAPAPSRWREEIEAEVAAGAAALEDLANALMGLGVRGQEIAAQLLSRCRLASHRGAAFRQAGARPVGATVFRPQAARAGARPLRILHISDLHERAEFEGMPPERRNKLAWDARQRGQVLGDRFFEALASIASGGIDLVCFTGDLADWGHPAEYERATSRIDAVLRTVRVPRKHFFAVPGNHDVQRRIREDAWKGIRSWLARTTNGGPELGRWLLGVVGTPVGMEAQWREQVLERTGAFRNWLAAFTGTDVWPPGSVPLGYRRLLAAGTFKHVAEPLHVIGLDSAWLCGAEEAQGTLVFKDQGSILVTEEQAEAHIRDGERPLGGFRVALVHHPLDHLADQHAVRRLLGDNGVDILLHGHQHTPLSLVSDEPGARLRVLASGCLMEGDLGKGWPNGFQLLEVDVPTRTGAVRFMKWSQDGRFWARGSDIYRDAPDGMLRWPVESASSGLNDTFARELEEATSGLSDDARTYLQSVRDQELAGTPLKVPSGFLRSSRSGATGDDRRLHALLRDLRRRGLVEPKEGGRWERGKAVVLTTLGRIAFRDPSATSG